MADFPDQPIPVTVVTGFLGAGKTTLINRLLSSADAQGLRMGLIVNDFGSINLDASELSQSGSTVLALEGGCVCCSLSNGLVSAILALSESTRRCEHILIEASGVSDPLGIVMPLVGAGLQNFVRLAAVVTVVDVGQVGQWPSDASAELSEAQVRGASAVVLSKSDQYSEAEQEDARKWIARLAPTARLLVSDEFAPELLLDTNRDVLVGLLDPAERERDEAKHLDAFDTWVLETEKPFFSLAELRRTLADLPNEVIRAKGVVSVADSPQPVRFHQVGRILATRFVDSVSAEPGADSSRVAVLGVAGTLDKAMLEAHFKSALSDQGDAS